MTDDVRRSLAQQEEYRVRDTDGDREPGTEAEMREQIARLRQQNHDAAAARDKEMAQLRSRVAGYDARMQRARELVRGSPVDWTNDSPSKEPDGWWRYTSQQNRDILIAAVAEARQQGRERAGRIELAARAVIATADVAGYTPQARLDALATLRWALASADGPPEPQDSGLDEFGNPAGFMATEPGIDVERLGVAMHRNAAASYRAPKRQQDALADRSAAESWREYAKRVVAEYDRLRADSRPEQPTPQDVDAARLQGAAEASREILDLLLPSELARVNAILNPAPRAVRPEEPPE